MGLLAWLGRLASQVDAGTVVVCLVPVALLVAQEGSIRIAVKAWDLPFTLYYGVGAWMPHVIEAAPTARSKCRGCGQKIAAGALRFGERLPNPFGDGDTTHWFHLDCAAYKRPEVLLEAVGARTEPLPGAEGLEAEARLGVEHPRLPRVKAAERAPSGRAQCRHCRQTIEKDAWRIALDFLEDGRFMPAGSIHCRCAAAYFGTADVLSRVRRFSTGLTDADLGEIQAELAAPSA